MESDLDAMKRQWHFTGLLTEADYQVMRTDVALRAGRPQTARKHALSAAGWIIEAELHECADDRREEIGMALVKFGEVFDRLDWTDRLMILMKTCFIRTAARILGAERVLPMIRAAQEVRYGR